MRLEKRNSANRLGGQYFYISHGRRWFSLWVSDRQLIEPAGRARVARELMRYRRALRGKNEF